MPSRILNFSKDRLITAINIIDGMLFFTDNETEPKKININKFKGEYPDVTVNHSTGTTNIYNRSFEERDITVIKEHPFDSISTSLTEVSGGFLTGPDVVNGDGDSFVDTGGGDIIDGGNDISDIIADILGEEPEPNQVMTVSTQSSSLTNLQNTKMSAIISNARSLNKKGFYYTFDAGVGNGERAAFVNEVSTGKAFKIENESVVSVGTNYFNTTINSNSPGLEDQAEGDNIWYMAYGLDTTDSSGEKYGNIVGPLLLKDATSVALGPMVDFELDVTYTGMGGMFTAESRSGNATFRATWTSDGNGQNIAEKFIVSKGYPEPLASGSEPTAAEVQEMVDNRVLDGESGDNGAFTTTTFPAVITSDFFNFGFTNSAVNTYTATRNVQSNPNYTYYAYAVKTMSNTGDNYSNVASFTTGETAQLPVVVQSAESYVNNVRLKGDIIRTGNDTLIYEKGFYFSKNISSLEDLQSAFSLGKRYDGTPVKDGFVDTYKVEVNTATENSNGTGEYSLDVSSYLGSLQPNEKVFYFAYVKNSIDTVGLGQDSIWGGPAKMFFVQALQADEIETPIIVLDEIGASTNADDDLIIDMDFTYSISYMPNNQAPSSSGVVFSLPGGTEITTYSKGFDTHEEIDRPSNRRTTVDRSKFTFTSQSDSSFLGKYEVEDFVFGKMSDSDFALWEKAIGVDYGFTNGKKTIYFSGYGNPFATAISAYAFVVHDGKTYKSEVKKGAVWGGASNNDNGLGSLNSFLGGGPTTQTRSNAFTDGYEDLDSNSVTLLGRFANDGNGTAFPLQEVGFYYSKTRPPTFSESSFIVTDSNYDEFISWATESSTYRVNVPITGAMNTFYGDTNSSYIEFSYDLTGLTSGDNLYFIAYTKPKQVAINAYFPDMSKNANKLKFSRAYEHVVVPAPRTAPDSGDNPSISVVQIDIGEKGLSGYEVTMRGFANSKADYYSVYQHGFYIKPKSSVPGGVNATDAQVKAAAADPASRITYSKNKSSFAKVSNISIYSFTKTLAEEDYYISAFCTVVINGTTTTYISTYHKEINLAASAVTTPADLTPVVVTKPVAGTYIAVLNGEIIQNNVDISDRGFYIVGKADQNFAAPSSSTALKTMYNTPPTGVHAVKLTGASGNRVFSESFDAQKKGYTYYYVAYATNTSGDEGLATGISSFYEPENVSKFIELAQNKVTINSAGSATIGGVLSNYPSTSFVRVKTENGYDGNWRIGTVPNWSSAQVKVLATRQYNNGEWKIGLPSQAMNFDGNRSADIKIIHNNDPTISQTLSLTQEGSNLDFDDIWIDPIDWDFGDLDFGDLDFGWGTGF